MDVLTINIQSSYGYVVVVVCLTWVMINWLSLQVVTARKRYNVSYPDMYSVHSSTFNCIQRAHQNTLENIPMFLTLLLLAGIRYPVISALSGLVWVASRITYAYGYSSGDPSKRRRGAYGYVGLLVLIICTMLFACALLQLI